MTAPCASACLSLPLPLLPLMCRAWLPRDRCAVSASAMIAEWTDEEFTAETLASFPDKAIATVEEARVGGSPHSMHAHSRNR